MWLEDEWILFQKIKKKQIQNFKWIILTIGKKIHKTNINNFIESYEKLCKQFIKWWSTLFVCVFIILFENWYKGGLYFSIEWQYFVVVNVRQMK